MSITSQLRRARLAVSVMFFVNGAMFASWASRIPVIKDALDLSEARLGWALFGISAGVLFALSLVGSLIARAGSERVTVAAGLAFCSSLPLLALAPGFWTLTAALFLFGGLAGSMDIAMNTQGVAVEDRYARSILTMFHALFSIGALVGAGFGALMAALDIEPLHHFAIVTLMLSIAVLATGRWLLPSERVTPSEAQAKGPRFSLPPRILWGIGVIAFCGAVGEGAMADWSAVYIVESLSAPESIGALGFVAFSLTMSVGRLTGDRLKDRFGAVRVVRGGGLLAVAGLSLALVIPAPAAAVIGFGLVGAGLSSIIPLVFSAAGRTPGMESGAALASVATIGYAGMLAGPPVIGQFAQLTSLRLALGLVWVMAVLIVVMAATVARKQPEESIPRRRGNLTVSVET